MLRSCMHQLQSKRRVNSLFLSNIIYVKSIIDDRTTYPDDPVKKIKTIQFTMNFSNNNRFSARSKTFVPSCYTKSLVSGLTAADLGFGVKHTWDLVSWSICKKCAVVRGFHSHQVSSCYVSVSCIDQVQSIHIYYPF